MQVADVKGLVRSIALRATATSSPSICLLEAKGNQQKHGIYVKSKLYIHKPQSMYMGEKYPGFNYRDPFVNPSISVPGEDLSIGANTST